jgi:hypothetical protein
MIEDEQNVINNWKQHVNTHTKFRNEFLKTFVGELLEYISNIKDQEKKHIMLDFIEKRKNFTSKTKIVIINYLKHINIQQKECELKKKFKLYIDLGSESREKIATSLTKQLEKINNIRIKDKQLIAKDESHKEKIEKLTKDNSKLTKIYARLSNEFDVLKSQNERQKEEIENLNKKIYNLQEENYKILKMQLFHSHK